MNLRISKFLEKVSKYLQTSQNVKNQKVIFDKLEARVLKCRFMVIFSFREYFPDNNLKFRNLTPKLTGIYLEKFQNFKILGQT
jgi:hypothetical protein